MNRLKSEYFFLPELPDYFNYTPVTTQYIKSNFTWLVKSKDLQTFFHYCRMPSGRLLCKWVVIPG